MNIKKILFLTISIMITILSIGIINNNVSANSNSNINSYPKSMRGTWYTGNGDKIKITKNTIKQPEYGKQYLHNFTDAKHNTLNPPEGTSNWIFANYTTEKDYGLNTKYNKKWINNVSWNATSVNGIFYNISKINGKKVLTQADGPTFNVNYQSYKNPYTAKQLQNKKYSEFQYGY